MPVPVVVTLPVGPLGATASSAKQSLVQLALFPQRDFPPRKCRSPAPNSPASLRQAAWSTVNLRRLFHIRFISIKESHRQSLGPIGGSGCRVLFSLASRLSGKTSAMSYNTDNNTPRSDGDSSLKRATHRCSTCQQRTCLFPGATTPPSGGINEAVSSKPNSSAFQFPARTRARATRAIRCQVMRIATSIKASRRVYSRDESNGRGPLSHTRIARIAAIFVISLVVTGAASAQVRLTPPDQSPFPRSAQRSGEHLRQTALLACHGVDAGRAPCCRVPEDAPPDPRQAPIRQVPDEYVTVPAVGPGTTAHGIH